MRKENLLDVLEHHCEDKNYQIDKFLQKGLGLGEKILIVGESLSKNGWRKSNRAFYTNDNKILPTGRVLNKLLLKFDLSAENCGFTNIAKCYIGQDKKLLNVCGGKCWKIFLRQVAANDFKLIMPLGKKTLEVFNNQLQSDFKTGELSKVVLGEKEYNLFPIFHPSPANPRGYVKNAEIFDRVYKDLIKII